MIKKILRQVQYKKKSYLTIRNLRYLRSIQRPEWLQKITQNATQKKNKNISEYLRNQRDLT